MKKGLGIATLSLGALLVFSGCSKDVAVNEETKEESVVATISKDEAYDIFKAVQYRFINNVDGVRNNLLVVEGSEGITKDHTSYYVDENGKEYVLKEIESGATYYEYALYYSKPVANSSDEIYMYAKRFNNAPIEITKRLEGYGNGVYYIAEGNSMMATAIAKDDLLEYRVLENGNYELAFVVEYEDTGTGYYSGTYVVLEVTKDYKPVSCKMTAIMHYEEYSELHSTSEITKLTYKYGEANITKINAMLVDANNA